MEFFFALPFILLPFVMPVITGLMAKSFGRKFWPWFFLAIPLPFVANVILLCLPIKKNEAAKPSNEKEAIDPFINQQNKKHKKLYHEQHLSA